MSLSAEIPTACQLSLTAVPVFSDSLLRHLSLTAPVPFMGGLDLMKGFSLQMRREGRHFELKGQFFCLKIHICWHCYYQLLLSFYSARTF